jgi:hypothetical protein
MIDNGIDGMSVYFMKVSYLPNCVFNKGEMDDDVDEGNELCCDDLFLFTAMIV